MADEFINLTPENVADEHICCIIRAKKSHPGIEAKCAWLAERLKEGHVFRKLDAKEPNDQGNTPKRISAPQDFSPVG